MTDPCLSVSQGTPVTWYPIPLAIDQTPAAMCEDVFGGGSVAGINLTSRNNSIDGGLNNTVNWYSNSTLTTLVGTPTNVTVTNTQVFYANVDNGNCNDTATITFTVNPLPTAIDQTPAATCEDAIGTGTTAGINLTALNANIDGGTGTTINWFSDITLSTAVGTPNNVTVSNAQIFYALVDNGMCSDTATVSFAVNPIPNSNAGTNDTSCTLAYNLNPTPSIGTGTWTGPAGVIFTPNATTPNATVTVPATGTYTFTWSETSAGCNGSDNVDITFNVLSIPFTPNNPTCNNGNNGSIVLAPQGGILPYSYLWDANAGNQVTNPATNLSANTFTVTVTDAFGCSLDSTITLTEPIWYRVYSKRYCSSIGAHTVIH